MCANRNGGKRLVPMNNSQISSIDSQFDFMEMVGKGTYGTAWIAKNRFDGKMVIVKAIKKVNTSKSVFKKEYKYSISLSLHPYIINTFRTAYETPKCYVMIQEFAPYGDLFDVIIPEQGMVEQEVKYTIIQISEALKFMHSKRLVHRDVKPENVVIMDKLRREIKLIDFGMTLRSGTHVARVCGSIPYTPPEICQASLTEGFYVGTGNDVWSLGVLLFCMLTGTFPWEQASPNDVHYKDFIDWQLSFSNDVAVLWRKFTPNALELFQKMLNLDITKRCKITELQNYLQYSWLQTNVTFEESVSDVSSLCRTPNPENNALHADFCFSTQRIPKMSLCDCSEDPGPYFEEKEFESYCLSHPKFDNVQNNQLSTSDCVEEDQFAHKYTSIPSHSELINLDTNSKSNDVMSDLVRIEQIDKVSNDTDLTVCVSNFNSTVSNVSPSHSHHFSDGFIPLDSNTLLSKSYGDVHHPRGSSLIYNISVC